MEQEQKKGAGTCIDCEPGKYMNKEGGTQCKKCDAGFYSSLLAMLNVIFVKQEKPVQRGLQSVHLIVQQASISVTIRPHVVYVNQVEAQMALSVNLNAYHVNQANIVHLEIRHVNCAL